MNASEIARQALQIREPSARAAFLDRSVGGDQALRSQVEALLAEFERVGDLTTAPDADGPDATTALDPTPDVATVGPSTADPSATLAATLEPSEFIEGPAGTEDQSSGGRTRISDRSPHLGGRASGVIGGRYELIELLGEGGMGAVYRARQTEPVRRDVALKLIRVGMASQSVLARFDAERQALAIMDHPNIARVYDGGLSAANEPYFVMELVRGETLTGYCDRRRLKLSARLELFAAVCSAVQHAHQKGIVHRDLKPGNVLVTEVDGRPTPKVIDFGVAKAVELRLTDLSLDDAGAIVGTPAYMSPEQADPSSMDIDTRTDVYALGVILYELLVGSPPIDAKQFRRGALLEMLRMVREADPPRPSTKLRSSNNLPDIAANRDIEPARLARSLQGELDWVVMKAIEKDRDRRYTSAEALARDVRRYLADEVVEARPPGRLYRLRKFVRRRRLQVAAASVVLLVLILGVIGTSLGYFEARRQTVSALAGWKKADENFAAARKLILSLGTRINQFESGQKDPRVADLARRQALDEARTMFDGFRRDIGDDESLQTQAAALHRYSGNMSRTLGDFAAASAAYAEAIRIDESLTRLFPNNPRHVVELALAMGDRALLELRTGKPKAAEATLRQARTIAEAPVARSIVGDQDRTIGCIDHDLAKVAWCLGRFDDSARLGESSREYLDRLRTTAVEQRQAIDPLLAVTAVNDVAKALRELGRLPEAWTVHEDAVARMRKIAGPKADRNELYWLCEVRHERAATAALIPERRVAAVEDLVEVARLADKLAEDYPHVAYYLEKSAAVHQQRGELLGLLGAVEGATAELTKSLTISRALLDRFGVVTGPMLVRGRTFLALARVRQAAGKPGEAETYRKNAAKVFEIALTVDPDNFHLRRGRDEAAK